MLRTCKKYLEPLPVLCLCILLSAVSGGIWAASAATPEGLWKTYDDKTGEARALVRIYRQDGALFGKIEATLVPDENEEHCSACTDERKGQPVVGLIILRGLKAEKDGFAGGDILDPETGSVYRCSLRLEEEGSRLIVRGYIGLSLFGRSQTWLRAD
jgi:uncharacterized protein (DUF2147 family)